MQSLRIQIDCIEHGTVRDSLMLTLDIGKDCKNQSEGIGAAMGTAVIRLTDKSERPAVVKAFQAALK